MLLLPLRPKLERRARGAVAPVVLIDPQQHWRIGKQMRDLRRFLIAQVLLDRRR